MKNKDFKTEQPDHEREPNHYETGITRPLKSRSGQIAVIMAVVIFFGGLLTALKLMDIPMAWQISNNAVDTPVRFCSDPDYAFQASKADAMGRLLGISGQDITVSDRVFYRLPQGVYITHAANSSRGFCQGLRVGDVLTACNGKPITSLSQLEQLLGSGDTLELSIYRNGTHKTIRIELD